MRFDSVSPLGHPNKSDNFFSLLEESKNRKPITWAGFSLAAKQVPIAKTEQQGCREDRLRRGLKAITSGPQLTHLSGFPI